MKSLSIETRAVGIVANTEKAASPAMVRRAAALIRESGRTVYTDPQTASAAAANVDAVLEIADMARRADLLLVFGGDGTMLRVAHRIEGAPVPILGVNLGGLGFLTAVSSDDLGAALDSVWARDFGLEPRASIRATAHCRTGLIRTIALNDIVISRGMVSRLIELEVSVDGEIVTRYRCDGLIISTPTGSTAYSLAAGGAIVSPSAEVFTLTPICPHTLSNRSVIVGLRSVIQVRVVSERPETILSADGQGESPLAEGDVVTIRRRQAPIHLMRLPGSSFFETLRRKLQWSGSNVTRG